MTTLPHARHRLAELRNRLHEELAKLRTSSTLYKITKGRLGGVMDSIQILDEELLAAEQGKAQNTGSVAWPIKGGSLSVSATSILVGWLRGRDETLRAVH